MAAFAGTYVPSQQKQPAPDSFGQGGYGQEGFQQDPYAGSQGGYQPDYGQQGGYNEGGDYSQGYEQQPTSYSNQMWACPVKPELQDGECTDRSSDHVS